MSMVVLSALSFAVLGYLSGSLPFSVWITRRVKGVDVRDAGSGHATATNTIRQAGFAPGVLVLLLDITKGFIPVWLTLRYAPAAWIVPLTAACVVIGHCWPVFAGFRGGMGLACTGGALLAAGLLPFLIAAAILITLTLTLRHGARAGVITALVMAPAYWLFGLRGIEFQIALTVGVVIASRFLVDWNRTYRELWLDREKLNKPEMNGDKR
jgi:acyl phosphate:glycerol-3-phosphate acyltransferase